MPQMAPMWWHMLYCTFILSMILAMMLVYFFNIYSPKKNIKKMYKNKEEINWKW